VEREEEEDSNRQSVGTSTAPLAGLCGLSLGVVHSNLFLSECGGAKDMGNVDNIHHGQIGEVPAVPPHMPRKCKYKNPPSDQNREAVVQQILGKHGNMSCILY
jgi:hypothetical protein